MLTYFLPPLHSPSAIVVNTYNRRTTQDVTQWPNLIARLLVRGVSDEHARMLVGENLLRMWTQVEEVAKTIQKEEWPDEAFWEDRLWEPEYPGVPRLFPPVQQKEEV